MSRHPAGTIVVIDWRGGSLPQEPGKLRPAVIVTDRANGGQRRRQHLLGLGRTP